MQDFSLLEIVKSKAGAIFLAPMEGVVDSAMRDTLTTLGGIDICVTEFVRVTDRLLPDHEFYKYCPELLSGARTRSGVPVLVQLLGGKPEKMAENAARATELGSPGIDINFGCPAKTVNRHDGGAALLKNPSRVFDVVKAVRGAVPRKNTVSAKVRLGFADKQLFREIAQAAAEGGANWLTVHARTRDEGYRPPAHWEYIAQIRESLAIPVIANGDIWTRADFERCQATTGCSTFMLGRGIIRSPDLALQIKKLRPSPMTWLEIAASLIHFTKLSIELQNENMRKTHYVAGRVKQWLKQLGRSYPDAENLFQEIKLISDCHELSEKIRQTLVLSTGLNTRL